MIIERNIMRLTISGAKNVDLSMWHRRVNVIFEPSHSNSTMQTLVEVEIAEDAISTQVPACVSQRFEVRSGRINGIIRQFSLSIAKSSILRTTSCKDQFDSSTMPLEVLFAKTVSADGLVFSSIGEQTVATPILKHVAFLGHHAECLTDPWRLKTNVRKLVRIWYSF